METLHLPRSGHGDYWEKPLVIEPLYLSALAGGLVWLLAQGSPSGAGPVSAGDPLVILAGVLSAVVALLGFIVRRQMTHFESQARSDREERELDRAKDREERAASMASLRDALADERNHWERRSVEDRVTFAARNDAVVAELRGLTDGVTNLVTEFRIHRKAKTA